MAKKRESPMEPAGSPKMLRQAILAAGADLLQKTDPLKGFDVYVVGFHCGKLDPAMQMEAHHYFKQVNADFLQGVLFDGSTEDANLIGIEYVISEKLFLTLPFEERKYWHPHNFEILSGTLVAPGLPTIAEKAMLRLLMNSYGKTFHTWHTGRHDGAGHHAEGHPLPMGDPVLMWSFNREGEMDFNLKRDGAENLRIDFDKKRDERQDLVDLAHPQYGVNVLKGQFPNASPVPPPGVRDVEEEDSLH